MNIAALLGNSARLPSREIERPDLLELFRAMPRRDYDGLPFVNWSSLKHLCESPLHYAHAKTLPHEDTPSLLLGRATHTAVLEPDRLPLDVAVFTGARRAGKEWDAFQAANAGRDLLKEAEWIEVCAIRDAVRSHPLAAPYLREKGRVEWALTWLDTATQLGCKGRPDLVVENVDGPVLVDLKTARSVDARAFGNAAARLGYHGQMAFYADGLAALGVKPAKVVLLVVENAPPYDVAVYVLAEDVLWAGRKEYRALLDRLARCLDEDRWPGRYTEEQALELPAWLFADDEADDFGLTVEV